MAKIPTKVDLGPQLTEREKRAGYLKMLGYRSHRDDNRNAVRRAKYRETKEKERTKRDQALMRHNDGIPEHGIAILTRLQALARSNAMKGRYNRNLMWKKRMLDGNDPLVALYEIAFDPAVDAKVRSYAAAEVRDTIYGKAYRPSISEKTQNEVNIAIAGWANGTQPKEDPLERAQSNEGERHSYEVAQTRDPDGSQE